MRYKVGVIIEKDEDGYYAWSPDLQGCQTQGDTLEETLTNMQEAVEVFLEALTPEERAECFNKEHLKTAIEVEVA
ncbi:MAG: type II toxin-antitoxin system HicB family antitoxin [Candidatus Hydrogenedentes bacterium]|nr:type II toxin-antitoxin system HicB family antitoxin [Candidatus Hydrogenedentota bacterium]